MPNGIVSMPDWIPAGGLGSTPLGELPRFTRALMPYRSDVMILSGLTSSGGRAQGDGGGDHARAGAAYLTGVHRNGPPARIFTPAFQWIRSPRRRWPGRHDLRPSRSGAGGLQGGNCDNGYSCAYSNSLVAHAEAPNPPETRPRAVFERMFGAVDDEKDPPAASGGKAIRRAFSTSCSATRRA